MNSCHSWANREVKRLCDMTIYTDLKQLHKSPGTTLSQKKKKQWLFIGITVPTNQSIRKAQNEKVDRYQELV